MGCGGRHVLDGVRGSACFRWGVGSGLECFRWGVGVGVGILLGQ